MACFAQVDMTKDNAMFTKFLYHIEYHLSNKGVAHQHNGAHLY